MNRKTLFGLVALIFLGAVSALALQVAPTELRLRGYGLVPAPQKVALSGGDIRLGEGWAIDTRGAKDAAFAAEWLRDKALELHGLELSGGKSGIIVLAIDKNAVTGIDSPGRADQAYTLQVAPGKVTITGNSAQGLFYGVQSLLQLLKRVPGSGVLLPAGTISDWPSLELRFVHWDTKHHQIRPADLRRILDWLALFKVNAIGFEMEDKYEFPSHPLAGAPGAYTKQEMQELTRYALERHIQLVPQIQAPSHMTWLLKYKEYQHLQADSSNYHMCMCDEEGMQIIRDLYQDMIDATPGVKYFHASTDEVYYAGICDKCQREYNVENRSLTWVEYVQWMHKWLTERGRTMLLWVEYPLLPEHIKMLPSGIIDAITSGGKEPVWIDEMNKAGIPQLAYSSMQGAEWLFPNLFPASYRDGSTEGRLVEAARTIPQVLAKNANLLGTFCAAWDDAGLHEETFWLGWVLVNQYGWNYASPSVDQAVADFMDVFYGRSAGDMVEAYKLLEEGARFYEDGWDDVPSTERGPAYGSSRGPFPYNRQDQTISMPKLPEGDKLIADSSFATAYKARIGRAGKQKKHNDRLTAILMRNLAQVERNQYNLEVYLSLARLERYYMDLLTGLDSAERSLNAAAAAGTAGEHAQAVGHMVEASNTVAALLEEETGMWHALVATWEKSRYPKNRAVDGREFYHVQDDVKDHFADRRKGLDYMLAPIQRMEIPAWREKLVAAINAYAAAHNVPVSGLAEPRLED